jgi:4-amino-4-deoxy-L-arabinose transferase-like glycosyltransferase
MGVVSLVLGWSQFSLRALTWLTLGGVLAILWAIAVRLAPDNREQLFWKSAAIYVSLPLTVVATTPAFHDHLLAVLCFASLYCAMAFAADRDVGHERIGFFYAAAVLAGLAVLTKYNGVLLVLGLVAFLVVHPGMRSLWRTPHPYVAALIVAALQVPVLIWNLGADLATLSLHFADRPTAHWSNPRPLDSLRFILTMILPLGPFFLLGFISLPFSKPASAVERTQRTLVYCVFLASTLSLAVAAMFTEIFLHWNIVAYVAAATLAAGVLRWRWLLWLHFALALYMGTVVTWNYAVTPIRVPLFEDPGTAANFGWPEVAEAVGKARDQHPDAFLAATRYT